MRRPKGRRRRRWHRRRDRRSPLHRSPGPSWWRNRFRPRRHRPPMPMPGSNQPVWRPVDCCSSAMVCSMSANETGLIVIARLPRGLAQPVARSSSASRLASIELRPPQRQMALVESSRGLPCAVGRSPRPRWPAGPASSAASTSSARLPRRSDIRSDCAWVHCDRAGVSRPAGAARPARARRARASSARAHCSARTATASRCAAARSCRLADAEHRFEPEAVGLHATASSSGTRRSNASVVAASE